MNGDLAGIVGLFFLACIVVAAIVGIAYLLR